MEDAALMDMSDHVLAQAIIQGGGTVILEGLDAGVFTVCVVATRPMVGVRFSKDLQPSLLQSVLYDAVPVVLEAGKQVEVILNPH